MENNRSALKGCSIGKKSNLDLPHRTTTFSLLMRRNPQLRAHLTALQPADRAAICPITRGKSFTDWSGCLKVGDEGASKQRLHTGSLNFHACLYQKPQETIT